MKHHTYAISDFLPMIPAQFVQYEGGMICLQGQRFITDCVHVDDAIGLLYTCPPCIGNVRLHKKERTAIRLSIASGTCTCLGKSIQIDSPGFDSPEVRIFFDNVFHFLIAVCEYSYQLHPIGLLFGSIPNGVTILFFHRV